MVLLFIAIGVYTIPAFGQSQSEIDIQAGAGSSSSASCISTSNCFSPNPLSITPGTIVTWKNLDSVGHTIASVDNQCNGPHFTIEIETDNKKVDPTVMVRTSLTEITYAHLAQYQPYAVDNEISPIRKLVYEAYVSPVAKSFEVVVVEGIGKNTFSVHKTVNVSGCNVGSAFESNIIQPENTFEFTFSDSGKYSYFCTIHPWLIGDVTVLSDTSKKSSTNSQPATTSTLDSNMVIPEFPTYTIPAMVIAFTVILFFRLVPTMRKID